MAAAPELQSIPVRRPNLGIDDKIPRVWHAAGPFATHFLNALSSVFPDGEAFFVRSVQRFRDEIHDPELQRAIRGFAGQEAQHSHQHDRHLNLLRSQGYTGLDTRNRMSRWFMKQSLRYFPKQSLVATASLEHLTAILARQLLQHPDRFTAPMHEQMAPLWQWHALEEAEHKSVAFDVMQQVAPSYWPRALMLFINSLGLFLETLDRVVYMLWIDGELFDRKVWSDGIRFLFGHGGLLRDVGAEYNQWYQRDFHPNNVDDGPLLAARQADVLAGI